MSCALSKDCIEQTIAFHGHSCPGLAIGIRASEMALRELGDPSEIDMVAVSETDMCGVDAIQFITGCTYGKGNFLHRDYGKKAFSFYDRETGKGVRLVLKESFIPSNMNAQQRQGLQDLLMEGELNDLFTVSAPNDPMPRPAQILESLQCAQCGESVMESRTRRIGGQTYCIPCFEGVEQKV